MKGSQLRKVISSFSELFEMPVKNDWFGIGYKPQKGEAKKMREERRKRRWSHAMGVTLDEPLRHIPHIRVTFPYPAETITSSIDPVPLPKRCKIVLTDLNEAFTELGINTIGGGMQEPPPVRKMDQGEVITNWTGTLLPFYEVDM